VSPLGTMINRVMISGVLTEIENSGTDDEPMWKGRVQDIAGNFFISVGKFQQEASASMANLEAPCYVSIIGKVRTYTTNDGRTFVSVRPEHIVRIEEDDYFAWLLETSRSLWKRLLTMRNVMKIPDVTNQDLTAKGFSPQEADGIITALDSYGNPESTMYLKMMQDALRRMLKDDSIDFGLPGDSSSAAEIVEKSEKDAENDLAIEDMVMKYLDEMDDNPRGAYIDDLYRKGEEDGIPAQKIDEITDRLMDKGVIYEPNLGYLKKI
ncbi:MAG: glycerol dehydrogenase, partial [Candidatus Methanomethylophilaceae archaeon]|nr:glycerol dehydrogenase [Candidatus Methanomethylophilaceae archaeon]